MNLINKLHHKLVMESTSSQSFREDIEYPLIKAIDTYKRNGSWKGMFNVLAKYLTYIYWKPLIITASIVLLTTVYSFKTIDDIKWKCIEINCQLYDKTLYSDSVYRELVNIIESKDYLRYNIFKTTEVLIPRNVPKEHIQLMLQESRDRDIPQRLYFKLIQTESRFDSSAKSPVGATGYMQLMPSTYTAYASQIGVTTHTPTTNIKVGTYLLQQLHSYWRKMYPSDPERVWKLTLASYNAGIGNVIDANNQVPEFHETKTYINKILNK